MPKERKDARTPRLGHVLLKAPASASSLSVGGETFEVVNGIVEVPEEHAHHLEPHGFTRADSDA